jgi:predicted N-acetyltransferase YhbS
MRGLISNPGFFGVVAERDGASLGSNFLDERSIIAAVGPVSVDPAAQDGRVGRLLMDAVLERAAERHAAGVRLLQIAHHNRSLALYAKLGFDVRGSRPGHATGWVAPHRPIGARRLRDPAIGARRAP